MIDHDAWPVGGKSFVVTLVRGCCTHPGGLGMLELFCQLLDTPTVLSRKGAGSDSQEGLMRLAGRAAGVRYRLLAVP